MLLNVADADCKMLLSIARQIGRESSRASRRCCIPDDIAIGESLSRAPKDSERGGRLAQWESGSFTRRWSAVRIRHRPDARCFITVSPQLRVTWRVPKQFG